MQLELEGVRLKTGLKLLLDQVGLTYRVVAEDNLMIITDQEGSEDPADRIWAELRALHRDLHAVQDAVDDLTDYLGRRSGEGARVRKPTIIEEMPENPDEKPEIGPEKPGRGGGKAGRDRSARRRARVRCPRAFRWRARAAVFEHRLAGSSIPNSTIPPDEFQISGKRMRQGSMASRAGASTSEVIEQPDDPRGTPAGPPRCRRGRPAPLAE